MSEERSGSVRMAQGYEVLPPKSGQAYPILCAEWDFLKGKIRAVAEQPLLFHTAGSVLLGAAVSTLTSILLGTFAAPVPERRLVVAWAVTTVTAICGVVCLFFAEQQRRMQKTSAGEIATQMEIIEKRYERATA
jgi:hypothetical protein